MTLQSLEKGGGFQGSGSLRCQERSGQRGLWTASEMPSGYGDRLKP